MMAEAFSPAAALVPTRKRRPPRRGFHAAAIALGLFLGLIVAEVVVRVMGIEPTRLMTKRQLVNRAARPPIYYHCYPDNPHGEFQTLPDTSQGTWKLQDYTFEHGDVPLADLEETPWCVEYRHSSKGIRDREIAPEPAPAVTRLAIVGDSFVFGEGVPENLTLPRQLAGELGPAVECVNGGQVGANTTQELSILNSLATEAACHRALLVYLVNDIGLTPELARRQDYINDLILVRDRYLQDARSRSLYTRIRVFDLITSPGMLRRVQTDTIAWYRDSYNPAFNQPNLEILAENFRAIARRKDCQTIIVLYPLMEGFETQYPLAELHETVTHLAETAGLTVLDLTPAFTGRSSRSLWVHEADHHPNGTAHRIAAGAIAKWVIAEHPEFLRP